MAGVILPPESRLVGGKPTLGSDMVLFRTAIAGLAGQVGLGGSGADGALTDLTTDYWPQPTTLELAGSHTAKHLSTIVATESITISGTLTVPTSVRAHPEAITDYYAGMPLPAWMVAGDGIGFDSAWSGDGGGGGSFGAGAPGGGSGSKGGRGWGDNDVAANLFSASTLWRTLRHLRGGFGGSGNSIAGADPDRGHPGGCLILLSEGPIIISGTINADGLVGGLARDVGGGGGGTIIAISATEVDGTGGVVTMVGGDHKDPGDADGTGGSGGGGYFAAIAPSVIMPTVDISAGVGRNAAETGNGGASHSETGLTAAQIRAIVQASGLLGSAAGAQALDLGLDE